MKVIFLDIDGVLNCEKYIRSCGQSGLIIDPSRMVLLKQIIDSTDAKIVLSTSWREHWDKCADNCDDTGAQMNNIFEKFGLKIFDKTPKLCMGRESEIKAWLEGHGEISCFAVLDDMLLCADYLDGHFVKTSNHFNGLDETDVKNAIEILNR